MSGPVRRGPVIVTVCLFVAGGLGGAVLGPIGSGGASATRLSVGAGPGTASAGSAAAAMAVGTTASTEARCSLSATEIEPGESVTLDASGSENATAYRFDKYGNGEFDDYKDSPEETYTYQEAGTYEPQVEALSADETTETATCGTLTVAEQSLEVTVSYAPDSPVAGESVAFDVSVSGDSSGSLGYEWDWTSDGSVNQRTDTADGVTHIYEQPGEYEVTVTVVDADGTTGSDSQTITVGGENSPPTADFVVEPAEPATGESTVFQSTADDSDGEVVEYEWRLDGEPISGESGFRQTFDEAGEHVVELTVVDDDGASDSVAREIQVEGTGLSDKTEPLTAEWWYSPLEPQRGEVVMMVASGNDGSGVTYRWDLDDDGEFERKGDAINHAFDEAGEYNVTLEVVDSGNRTNASIITITVGELPAGAENDGDEGPSVWFIPLEPEPGELVTLFAEPVGSMDTEIYKWDLDGDGEVEARGNAVNYRFPEDGQFSVTLVLEGSDGSETSVEETVAVGNATIQTTTAAGDGTTITPTGDGPNTGGEATGTSPGGDGPGPGLPGLGLPLVVVLTALLGLFLWRRDEE